MRSSIILGHRVLALHLSLISTSRVAPFLLRSHQPKFAKWHSSGTSSSQAAVGRGDVEEEPLKIFSQDDRIAWDDRASMQDKWSNKEKGWKMNVEWKHTEYGIGLFAKEDIPKDTIIRVGRTGHNLKQFRSQDEILAFCEEGDSDEEYQARLRYAKDYIWGQPISTDKYGFAVEASQWFYGMWLPGNGLNHSPIPNTVYHVRPGGTDVGIYLVALIDIQNGDELVDDYRRHGSAPEWLKQFANRFNVTLNFADCNEFVG